METKKWKLLTEPIQLDETSIIINKNNPILIPTYTLQSLDLMTQDYDVKQKIKERWLKASEKNPKLRPGLKFRLISYPKEVTSVASSRLAESYDEPEPVFGLDLGITDYGVFVATNGAAKEDKEYTKYLMDKGKEFYNNEFEYFASPVGNCAIVESSDNKIALIKRAEDLYEYPGFYDTPGGHAEPLKHSFDSKGQFDAIKDETSEEIKIPKESFEEAYLSGISVNKETFRKPDLLFYLKTDLHSSKMDANEEVSGLERLSKDELFEHWKKRTYNIVPPSEFLLFAYYSLQKGYDLSFVENEI